MSDGIRSGVNCMRLNVRFMLSARVRIMSVFASPGTPTSRQWPAGEERDEQLLDHVLLADDDLAALFEDALAGGAQPIDRVRVVAAQTDRFRSNRHCCSISANPQPARADG